MSKKMNMYVIWRGKRYRLIRDVYDPIFDCSYYYVEGLDQPLCDLDECLSFEYGI